MFLSFLAWFSTLFISYSYKEALMFLLIKPTLQALNLTSMYFIYTGITEIFGTYLKLITFVSNQILFIYLIYHLLTFLSPGLYYSEHYYIKLAFTYGVMFWCCSILILNKLLLPVTLEFFSSFQGSLKEETIQFHFEAKIMEYFEFYTILYYICSLNCQFFTVIVVFLDYINADLIILRTFRKFFYLFFVLSATTFTPPDVISQIILSSILVLIYELLTVCTILKQVLSKS